LFASVLAPAEDPVGGISSLEENIGAMDAHVAASSLQMVLARIKIMQIRS
jgi:hypothetical protein